MPYHCKNEETTEEEPSTNLVEGFEEDPEEKIPTQPLATLEDNSQSFPPFVVFALS